MGASTNISSHFNCWALDCDAYDAASHQITTCGTGPANDCVVNLGTDPFSD